MKIRTRLLILFASVAVVFVATLGGIFYADYQIDQTLYSSKNAYEIVNRVSGLNRLVTEISNSGLQRIRQQWGAMSVSLRVALDRHLERDTDIASMTQELGQLDTAFQKLMDMYAEEKEQGFSVDFSEAKKYRLNNISVLLHSLSNKADTIATDNFKRVRDVQLARDTFLLSIGVLWCIAVALWATTLWNGFMSPLQRLLKAIEVVGRGDMSHRIRIVGNGNEMNNLTRSFNSMLDRLQDLTVSRNRVLTATDQERKRIGRDLHDGICQMMTGIRLQAESLARKDKDNRTLCDIVDNLKQAQVETQRIVKALHPAMLDEMGIIATMQWLVEQVQGTTSVTLSLDVDEADIPPDLHTPIFRITQEAINNTIRHGEAKTIHVQMVRQNDDLDLFIEDDGHGFNPASPNRGNGLINIRERVEANGGEFSIDSAPGRGCCIIASFPISDIGL